MASQNETASKATHGGKPGQQGWREQAGGLKGQMTIILGACEKGGGDVETTLNIKQACVQRGLGKSAKLRFPVAINDCQRREKVARGKGNGDFGN